MADREKLEPPKGFLEHFDSVINTCQTLMAGAAAAAVVLTAASLSSVPTSSCFALMRAYLDSMYYVGFVAMCAATLYVFLAILRALARRDPERLSRPPPLFNLVGVRTSRVVLGALFITTWPLVIGFFCLGFGVSEIEAAVNYCAPGAGGPTGVWMPSASRTSDAPASGH